MTIKDLIEVLKQHPKDMLVLTQMMSCLEDIEPPTVVKVFKHVSLGDGVYERFYERQWKTGRNRAGKPEVFDVLFFRGN